MFDKFKDMMGQFQLLQRLTKDENFKAFMTHPKVQELLCDPDFQELIKIKDRAKLSAQPKFAALMGEPELASLAAKLKPQDL